MSRIDFYHLQKTSLDRALPELLERAMSRGMRIVITTSSTERVRHLDSLLWTYRDESWLPHGCAPNNAPECQPVWITNQAENPNGANLLVITDGADFLNPAAFERCLDLFDGNQSEDVAAARQRWVKSRDANHQLAYWQQDSAGHWHQKATANA